MQASVGFCRRLFPCFRSSGNRISSFPPSSAAKMAEASPEGTSSNVNLEAFKEKNLSAFVTGHTGGIGKVVVQELDRLKIFKRVVLIGRREVELSVGPEFEQKVIDYDKLDEHADLFKDTDIGFHLIGTVLSNVDQKTFYKVDHDYFLKIAEIAKANSCKHLLMVTSVGSDPKSRMFYYKTKGEVEETIKGMGFDRVTICQPAALLGERKEGFKEQLGKFFFKPIFFLFPTALSVPRASVAKALIGDVVNPPKDDTNKVRVLSNKQIHHAAKDCP